ncbi:hypothetical protein [Parapedobacter sp.]
MQRNAQQGLRLVLLARQGLIPCRMLQDEHDTTGGPFIDARPAFKKEVVALPDDPSDGRYHHITPFKTEWLHYHEILEFVLVSRTVFMLREAQDNETVKQRSLKAVEIATGGYFRKVNRNRAIPHHRLKRCVAHNWN